MNLDHLAIRLRARSDWEAVDLGFTMVRAWRSAIYGPWLAIAGPAASLLIVAFGVFGLLAFWWLLPLWEMLALDVISRATFGDAPNTRQVVRSAPGLWKRGLAEILWRRFHLARSFRLPVFQLENATGGARKQRIKALESRASDVPSWLTLSFFSFHVGVTIGAVVLIWWMIPNWAGMDWERFNDLFWEGQTPIAYRSLSLLTAAIILAINPFYVAAGFALYINRRVELEGWDLDLAFRRMAHRLRDLGLPHRRAADSVATTSESDADPTIEDAAITQSDSEDSGPQERSFEERSFEEHSPDQDVPDRDVPDRDGSLDTKSQSTVPQSPIGSTLAVFFCAGLLGFMLLLSAPGNVFADSETRRLETRQGVSETEPQAAMAEVMAMEELQTHVDVEQWRLRDDIDLPLWQWDSNPGRNLNFSLPDFSTAIEALLWIGIAVLVLLLMREGLKKIPASSKETDVSPIEAVLGLDIRRDSLPDDVPAAAERLWMDGKKKQALRLLYRASLSHLHTEGMELRESFTENDCLLRAQQLAGPERFRFFTDLTIAWQATAYAHRLPNTDHARTLWQQWKSHFGSPIETPL